jgi:hypothetical protein
VAEGEGDAVGVCVGVGVPVWELVCVGVGDDVAEGVWEGEGDAVGVWEGEEDAVGVWVGEGDAVGVAVGVGEGDGELVLPSMAAKVASSSNAARARVPRRCILMGLRVRGGDNAHTGGSVGNTGDPG